MISKSFSRHIFFSINPAVLRIRVGSKTESHGNSILANRSRSSSYGMIIKAELANEEIIQSGFSRDSVFDGTLKGNSTEFIEKNECREKRLETI